MRTLDELIETTKQKLSGEFLKGAEYFEEVLFYLKAYKRTLDAINREIDELETELKDFMKEIVNKDVD